jgi:Tfp pilus assembly protein PilO
VFSLIVSRLVLNPAISRIEALNKEIGEQEENIKKSLLILSRQDEIISENDKYLPYFENAESKTEEPILFLKTVENLAKNSSVEIMDIKPAAPEESESIKEYFVSLSCEAPMEKIFDFLYGVESSEQLLSVERIVITPKEDQTDIVRCSMYISKVLILPSESELTVE